MTFSGAVGERIATFRAERGYALDDLAAASSVDLERLADAEDGVAPLADDELQRLADAFGIDVTALFGGRVTPFNYLAGA